MRRQLKWLLAGTLALTALAMLPWPASAPVEQRLWQAARSANAPAVPALPEQIDSPGFAPAHTDLFAGPAPPQAVVQTRTPPVMPPPSPQIAPPPPPRPMTTYLGQMRSPEGNWMVYLRDGERSVLAQPGTTLSGGYVIEGLVVASGDAGGRIAAVQLLYPPAQYRQTLDLPMEPGP